MTHCNRAAPLALAFALSAFGASAQEAPRGPDIAYDDAPWRQVNDAGMEVALLSGDPTAEGVYSMLIKLPAGVKLPVHVHADAWRHSVVLSGTLYFGFGDTWDEEALVAYGPGDFWTEAPNDPHFAWTKDGEVVGFLTAMGPTGTTVLAPPPQ